MRSLPSNARILLLAVAAVAAPVFAQSEAQCIVAGRLSDGAWAPRFAGVQLLDAGGKAVTASGRQALAQVRQARLARPALLAQCNGDQPLANGDELARAPKSAVPALSAGVVAVEGVSFPKLRTAGGELVELRVSAPAERVVMVTR